MNRDNKQMIRKQSPAAVAMRRHDLMLRSGLLLLFCGLVSAGCAGMRDGSRQAGQQEQIVESQEELRVKVTHFVEFFESTIERGASDIERGSDEASVRRAAAQWRIQMISECRVLADNTDARRALLDIWTLCRRMRDYFSTGAGKNLFGQHQSVARNVSESIYDAMRQLARGFVAEASFDTLEDQIAQYSMEHPIEGQFATRPVERLSSDPKTTSALQDLIDLPLVPIRALTAVGKGPESIQDVSQSMDRFTDVVEDIPGNARWQLKLLAMDVEEMSSVSTTVASVSQFSDSSARLADSSARLVEVMDAMPKQVREQTEILLNRLDESQPQLQSTLRETQKTSESIQALGREVRGTVDSVEHTVAKVQEASAALEKAAGAVTVTVQEIGKLLPAPEDEQLPAASVLQTRPSLSNAPGEQLIAGTGGRADEDHAMTQTGSAGQPDMPAGPTSESDEASFSLQLVTESANALGETSDKLQGLLADFRDFVEASVLDRQLESTLGATRLSLEGLVDHVAKRLAQLIMLAFAMIVTYRLAITRWQRRVKTA